MKNAIEHRERSPCGDRTTPDDDDGPHHPSQDEMVRNGATSDQSVRERAIAFRHQIASRWLYPVIVHPGACWLASINMDSWAHGHCSRTEGFFLRFSHAFHLRVLSLLLRSPTKQPTRASLRWKYLVDVFVVTSVFLSNKSSSSSPQKPRKNIHSTLSSTRHPAAPPVA